MGKGCATRRRSFSLKMKNALLGIDIHAKIAEEIEPEQPGDLGVRDSVVNSGRQVANLHAANQ